MHQHKKEWQSPAKAIRLPANAPAQPRPHPHSRRLPICAQMAKYELAWKTVTPDMPSTSEKKDTRT